MEKPMPSKLRWGILSTAKIGIRQVIPAVQQSSNGVVAAIASRDARTAQEVAKSLNIPRALGSYDALLDDPEIDAIYIPLPNHLHQEWSIRALQRGKHVLCEKPFALNAAQVDEMIAAAWQSRRVLMEAFMYRFHPQFALAQKLIAEGKIGEIKTIRVAFGFNIRGRPNDIRLKKEMGGGGLMDVGSYCVNMARLIAGAEPFAVQANAVFGVQSQVDETLAAILRFPNDVIALFDCGLRGDYREWLQVQGTDGRLEVVRPVKPCTSPAEIVVSTGETGEVFATPTKFTAPAANHYQLMVEHFAGCVQNSKPLQFPPEDGRANMRVIDALYESARSGCVVQIK
jgi:D-xylose 1-dehydrogenase (NADP+, D-xylono-1,5-lactone-forming)